MKGHTRTHTADTSDFAGGTDAGVTVTVGLLPGCWCFHLHNIWRLALSSCCSLVCFIFSQGHFSVDFISFLEDKLLTVTQKLLQVSFTEIMRPAEKM